jgi:hypothetical protein
MYWEVRGLTAWLGPHPVLGGFLADLTMACRDGTRGALRTSPPASVAWA